MSCCDELRSAIDDLASKIGQNNCCDQIGDLKARIQSLEGQVNDLRNQLANQNQDTEGIVQKAIAGVFGDARWTGALALIGAVQIAANSSVTGAAKALYQAEAAAEATKYYSGRIAEARAAAEKAFQGASAAGSTASQAAQSVSRLAPLIGIVTALVAVAAAWQANEIQGSRNDAVERMVLQLSSDTDRYYHQYQITKQHVDRLESITNNLVPSFNRLIDQVNDVDSRSADAKKQANDALYAGNKANEKIAAIQPKVNALSTAVDVANNAISGTTDAINSAAQKANDGLYAGNRANEKIAELSSKLNDVEYIANRARQMANDGLYAGNQANEKIVNLNDTLSYQVGQQVTQQVQQVQQQVQQVQQQTQQVQQVQQVQQQVQQVQQVQQQVQQVQQVQQQTQQVQQIQQQQVQQVQQVTTSTYNNLSSQVSNVQAQVQATDNRLTTAIVNNTTGPASVSPQLTQLQTQVNQLKQTSATKAELAQIKPTTNITNITQVKSDVNQQDVTDMKSALSRIEQKYDLLPAALVPAIARTPMNVGSFSPEAKSGLEAAATAGVCNSTKAGGCMANALSPIQNGLDKINTGLGGLNAGLITNMNNTVNTINGKIGAAIPGGLSGFLTKAWDVLQIDRVINILSLYTTLHNATMLSTDIFQTLVTGVEQLLGVVGLKNEKDQPIQIREVVGKATEDFLKDFMGAKNYEELKTRYNQLNRIYQAATNALGAITNIFYSLQNVLQVVGQYVAQIGNALRDWGVVADSAYAAMSERISAVGQLGQLQKVMDGLQEASQVASNFSAITSEMVNVKQNVEELTKDKKEFDTLLSGQVATRTAIENQQANESISAIIDSLDLVEVETD